MAWRRRGDKDLAGQPERVYAVALQFLSLRDYAPRRLYRKLLEKGADEAAAQEAIARLREQGYLDELRMIESRIHYRCHEAPRGRAFIRQELLVMGFEEVAVEQGLAQYYSQEQEARCLLQLLGKLLPAVTKQPPGDQAAALAKLIRAMQRKGFPLAMIDEALAQIETMVDVEGTLEYNFDEINRAN